MFLRKDRSANGFSIDHTVLQAGTAVSCGVWQLWAGPCIRGGLMSKSYTSLSGRWLGRYEYPDGREPVPFEAVLAEELDLLAGEIEEPNTFAQGHGPVLSAMIEGSRDGLSVEFRKRYHGFALQSCPQYDGEVNAALTRIEGIWRFAAQPGFVGRFVMMRKPMAEARLERAITEEVGL